MDKFTVSEDYDSSDDELYVPPEDAPPENENDAFLVKKDDDSVDKQKAPSK